MYSLKFSLFLFQSNESYGPVTLTLITVHISITLSLRVGFVKMQLNLNRLVLFGIHSRFNALLLLLLSQRIWPFGCFNPIGSKKTLQLVHMLECHLHFFVPHFMGRCDQPVTDSHKPPQTEYDEQLRQQCRGTVLTDEVQHQLEHQRYRNDDQVQHVHAMMNELHGPEQIHQQQKFDLERHEDYDRRPEEGIVSDVRPTEFVFVAPDLVARIDQGVRADAAVGRVVAVAREQSVNPSLGCIYLVAMDRAARHGILNHFVTRGKVDIQRCDRWRRMASREISEGRYSRRHAPVSHHSPNSVNSMRTSSNSRQTKNNCTFCDVMNLGRKDIQHTTKAMILATTRTSTCEPPPSRAEYFNCENTPDQISPDRINLPRIVSPSTLRVTNIFGGAFLFRNRNAMRVYH